MSRRDGDSSGFLLRGLVDLVERHRLGAPGLRQHLGDGGGEGGLAVVDVADGADVDVGLRAGEGGHGPGPEASGQRRRRRGLDRKSVV